MNPSPVRPSLPAAPRKAKSLTVHSLLAGLAVLLALLGPLRALEAALLRAMAPAWAALCTRLDPDFQVTRVDMGRQGGEQVLRMDFAARRFVVVGGVALDPTGGLQGSASMPRGTVWQMVALYLAVLAGWPWRLGVRFAATGEPAATTWRTVVVEMALRAALGVAGLVALLGLAVPAQMIGHLREAMTSQWPGVDPGAWPAVGRFLADGGRLALALALPAASAALAARLAIRVTARPAPRPATVTAPPSSPLAAPASRRGRSAHGAGRPA